jgi:hypothetical protein
VLRFAPGVSPAGRRVLGTRVIGPAGLRRGSRVAAVGVAAAGRLQRVGDGAHAEPGDERDDHDARTEPTHELELESSDVTIRGVAWSGAAPIARVDVSVDNGPWTQARLLGTRQRHSWQWWELIVVLDRSGPHTIRARATDLAGRTQPDEPEWNSLGYGSNAIQEVRVHSA